MIPALREGTSAIGRVLFFEFYSGPNQLMLSLYIGPGPDEVRRRILAIAREGAAARPSSDRLGKQWKTLRNWRFLRPNEYESASPAELMETVRARWSRLVQEDLPGILRELSGERLEFPSAAPPAGAEIARSE